jgi:hypothetical protein
MARIGLGALIAFEYSAIPLYLHSSTPFRAGALSFGKQASVF